MNCKRCRPIAILAARQLDDGFCLGANIWIHRHFAVDPMHFHLLLDLSWWYVELRIGKDGPPEVAP